MPVSVRVLAIVVAIALATAACAGGGETASGDRAGATASAPVVAATTTPESSAPEDLAPDPVPTEPSASDSDAHPCGLDAQLTPDNVEIAQIDGDPRDDSPSALVGNHPDFPDPLVDPDLIVSGGPPPDGIPPLDEPHFQTVASVDWLNCVEPVLSLEIDGDVRAYPIQIMTWHEIVNDTVGETPVTISFCPLCNSALVYRRDVGGRILDFGTSGRLFNSSLVMYDRQTESLWTHFDGSAVVGALTGTELELVAVQMTSWQNFRKANPGGVVLTRGTGFDRPYGRNPYEGYDTTDNNPFLFFGDLDDRLAAKQRVVSIEVDDDSVAIPLDDLVSEPVIDVDVGGQALTVWHLPGTSSALDTARIDQGRDIGTVGVFVPEIDGRSLSFNAADDGTFADAETGSTWTIDGRATGGALKGSRLEAIEHLDTFWFAIAAFEPDTRIVGI